VGRYLGSVFVVGALVVAGLPSLAQAGAVAAVAPPDNPVESLADVADLLEQPAVLTPGTVSGVADDVATYRDQFTRSTTNDDGDAVTEVFFAPVNYQTSDGAWAPIDSTLKPVEGGWANTANSWSAFLPDQLSADHSPSMTLPSGGTLNVALVGAEGAPVAVDGASAVYRQVLPGIDATYDIGPTGMKSDLLLSSAATGARFEFTVTGSDKVQLRPSSTGIAVSDATGEVAQVAAPSARDAAGAEVVTTVEVAGDQLVVSVDDKWLNSPERVWPVDVDPVVTLTGSADTVDCYISQYSPTFNDCTSTQMGVGFDSSGNGRRAILKFPGATTALPYDDVITDASLQLYLHTNVTTAASTLAAYPITNTAWTTGVTWATTNGTTAWATPGGELDTANDRYMNEFSSKQTTSGSYIGEIDFSITNMVRDWLNAVPLVANAGLMIIGTNPAVNQLNYFRSSTYGTTAQQPRLVITHHPRVGTQSAYQYKSFNLGNRLAASVNLANGNLAVEAADVNIAGTGMPLSITRTYNSSGVDAGWAWSTTNDVRLGVAADGNVNVVTGDQHRFAFIKRDNSGDPPGSPPGQFFAPPFIAATLTAHPSNPGGQYELHFDKTDITYFFDLQTHPTFGVLKKIVDRDGHTITINYPTGSTQWTTITDTQGRAVTATWASSRLEKITDSTGRIVDYVYNGAGQLASVIDPASGTTTYTYNSTSGLLETITTPAGEEIEFTYSGASVVLTEEVFDDTLPDASDSNDTSISYALNTANHGNTTLTDARAKVWVYDWDVRDRVTKQTKPNGDVSTTTVYSIDDQASKWGPSTSEITNAIYDTNTNDLLSTTQPSSDGAKTAAVTSLDYSTGFRGRPSSIIDPRGDCQRNKYDTVGRLTDTYTGLTPSAGKCDTVTNTFRTITTYTTGPNPPAGLVATITDPIGAVTTYGYDTLGNLSSITYPGSLGAWSFTVDALSRPTVITDGRGKITRYAYDALDRPTKVATNNLALASCTTGATECSLYSYDADGHITVRADAAGTTNYTYNQLGWLAFEQLPGNANACTSGTLTKMEFTYTPVGELATHCDAAGMVVYSYDAAQRNSAVREPGGDCTTGVRCTTYTYDTSNRRQVATYPGGTTHSIFYDNAGNIKQIVATDPGGSSIFNRTYTWFVGLTDKAILESTTQMLSSVTTNYTYDKHDWLTSADDGTDTTAWTYDNNGNRLTETLNGATTNTATYSIDSLLCWTKNAATVNTCAGPPTGAVTYTNDAGGNITANSTGTENSVYNAKNQTTTWGGNTNTYAGTNQNERTAVGTTAVYNSEIFGIVGTKTGTANTYYYYNATGERIGQQKGAASTRYTLADYHGSTTTVVNNAGVVDGRIAYNPWGAQTSNTLTSAATTPFGYNGGYTDNTTTRIKYGARYYNPTLGRFTQEDPSGYSDGPNRQTYAGNNPTSYTDPTGLSFGSLFDNVVSGVAGIVVGAAATFISGGNPWAGAIAGGCAALVVNQALGTTGGLSGGEAGLACLAGGALGAAGLGVANYVGGFFG
jgi:RHS repeat-associated protein